MSEGMELSSAKMHNLVSLVGADVKNTVLVEIAAKGLRVGSFGHVVAAHDAAADHSTELVSARLVLQVDLDQVPDSLYLEV